MNSNFLVIVLIVAFFILGMPFSAQENTIKLKKPIVLDKLGNHDLLGPDLADLNSDGKLELIVGNYGGSLFVLKNSANWQNPVFNEEQKIQSASKPIKINHW